MRFAVDLYKDIIAFGLGWVHAGVDWLKNLDWAWKLAFGPMVILFFIPSWIRYHILGTTAPENIYYDCIHWKGRNFYRGSEVIVTMKDGRQIRGEVFGRNFWWTTYILISKEQPEIIKLNCKSICIDTIEAADPGEAAVNSLRHGNFPGWTHFD